MHKIPLGYLKWVDCVAMDAWVGVPMTHCLGVNMDKMRFDSNTLVYKTLDGRFVDALVVDSFNRNHVNDQKDCEYCSKNIQGISVNRLANEEETLKEAMQLIK